MSKAFTREDDDRASPGALDRVVSHYLNLVTAEGLAAIEGEFNRLSDVHAEAIAAGDREAAARANRDLRYFAERRRTARLRAPPANTDEVSFGSRVLLRHADGRVSQWRIVGEDEADPAKGLLFYMAPLARALLGKSIGESVNVGPTNAVIDEIAP